MRSPSIPVWTLVATAVGTLVAVLTLLKSNVPSLPALAAPAGRPVLLEDEHGKPRPDWAVRDYASVLYPCEADGCARVPPTLHGTTVQVVIRATLEIVFEAVLDLSDLTKLARLRRR